MVDLSLLGRMILLSKLIDAGTEPLQTYESILDLRYCVRTARDLAFICFKWLGKVYEFFARLTYLAFVPLCIGSNVITFLVLILVICSLISRNSNNSMHSLRRQADLLDDWRWSGLGLLCMYWNSGRITPYVPEELKVLNFGDVIERVRNQALTDPLII